MTDPEVLFREARERQRRRRARRAIALVCALAAIGLAYVVARATRSSATVVRVSGGPVVNVSAFADHGRLAFVSRGVLWVLDGGHGSLRRMPTPRGSFTPLQPVFSADGRWLAYLERRNSSSGTRLATLWIARSDGTHAHVVAGLGVGGLYGWSPTRDLLAVTTGPLSTRACPCRTPTTLRLVSPDGSSRRLAEGRWIYSAAWSPDGRSLALGIESRSSGGLASTIVTYPENGARPTVWLRAGARDRLNGMRELLFEPAGWWRGYGIGFWAYGDGAIRSNDASPLDVIAAPGEQPRLLAQTLSDGTTDVDAASDRGALALVAEVDRGRGEGRVIWHDKQVQVCEAGHGCRGLIDRPSRVTLDPVWSPDGHTLAFDEAPDMTDSGWPQRLMRQWYADHSLQLYDRQTRTRRSLPQAKGATVPAWSADGASLLYVADDGLWLLPTLSSNPVEIASPLFPQHDWPAYYGQIAWTAQFAWTTTPAVTAPS